MTRWGGGKRRRDVGVRPPYLPMPSPSGEGGAQRRMRGRSFPLIRRLRCRPHEHKNKSARRGGACPSRRGRHNRVRSDADSPLRFPQGGAFGEASKSAVFAVCQRWKTPLTGLTRSDTIYWGAGPVNTAYSAAANHCEKSKILRQKMCFFACKICMNKL